MVGVGDEAGHDAEEGEGVDLEVGVVEGEVSVGEAHEAVVLLVHVDVLHDTLLDEVYEAGGVQYCREARENEDG